MEKNSLPIFISILGIIFFSLAIMFYIYYYRKYNRKSSNVNQQRDEMFVSIIDYIEKNPSGKKVQTLYSNSKAGDGKVSVKCVAYIDFFPHFFRGIITIIARETFIYQQQYKNTWTDISHISRLIDRDRRSKAIESFCVVNNVEYEFIYKK